MHLLLLLLLLLLLPLPLLLLRMHTSGACFADLLDSSTGGPLKLHLKSGEVWRAVTANPASFGSGYPRMPPPSKASAASSGGPQVAALPSERAEVPVDQ